jgi:hypothetical protein
MLQLTTNAETHTSLQYHHDLHVPQEAVNAISPTLSALAAAGHACRSNVTTSSMQQMLVLVSNSCA